MEKKKVAINGLGRIGRNTLKIVFDEERDFEIVALNDLTDAVTLAHLIKYDSCFGRFDKEVEILIERMYHRLHLVKHLGTGMQITRIINTSIAKNYSFQCFFFVIVKKMFDPYLLCVSQNRALS